ncbi:hypothetical protein ACJX0J_007649, partial [Zea mays]
MSHLVNLFIQEWFLQECNFCTSTSTSMPNAENCAATTISQIISKHNYIYSSIIIFIQIISEIQQQEKRV